MTPSLEERAREAISKYYAQNDGRWSEDLPKGNTLAFYITKALKAYGDERLDEAEKVAKTIICEEEQTSQMEDGSKTFKQRERRLSAIEISQRIHALKSQP